MVACLEEIAFKMKFVDADRVRIAAENMKGNAYGQYLLDMLAEEARENLEPSA
jgi:glucose-1-phosphate thymidylyltransferase